jgi:hypothetical protein
MFFNVDTDIVLQESLSERKCGKGIGPLKLEVRGMVPYSYYLIVVVRKGGDFNDDTLSRE